MKFKGVYFIILAFCAFPIIMFLDSALFGGHWQQYVIASVLEFFMFVFGFAVGSQDFASDRKELIREVLDFGKNSKHNL